MRHRSASPEGQPISFDIQPKLAHSHAKPTEKSSHQVIDPTIRKAPTARAGDP